MNERNIIGFLKRANQVGAHPADVAVLLKIAVGEDVDPNAVAGAMQGLEQGGGDPAAGGMPPQDPSMGGAPGMDPAAGGNPQDAELEQILSQLGPEELQALIADISQRLEAAEGGAPGGAPGGDPAAGGPPMDPMAGVGGGMPPMEDPAAAGAGAPPMDPMAGGPPKQASYLSEEELMLKHARSEDYIQGFVGRALLEKYTVKQALDFYTYSYMNARENVKRAKEQNKLDQELENSINEKGAAWFEGVFNEAIQKGYTEKQAFEILNRDPEMAKRIKEFTTK